MPARPSNAARRLRLSRTARPSLVESRAGRFATAAPESCAAVACVPRAVEHYPAAIGRPRGLASVPRTAWRAPSRASPKVRSSRASRATSPRSRPALESAERRAEPTSAAEIPAYGEQSVAEDHLSTPDVRRRAVTGAVVDALRAIGVRLVGLLGTLVTARLLTPYDFGLVAIGTTVLDFRILARRRRRRNGTHSTARAADEIRAPGAGCVPVRARTDSGCGRRPRDAAVRLARAGHDGDRRSLSRWARSARPPTSSTNVGWTTDRWPSSTSWRRASTTCGQSRRSASAGACGGSRPRPWSVHWSGWCSCSCSSRRDESRRCRRGRRYDLCSASAFAIRPSASCICCATRA